MPREETYLIVCPLFSIWLYGIFYFLLASAHQRSFPP